MADMESLQKEAYEIALEKGFHDSRSKKGRDDTLVRLALIHSEVSEAVQEVKRHFPTVPPAEPDRLVLFRVGEELADIIIRVFDLASCLNLDMDMFVSEKMEKNRGRPKHYGTIKAEPTKGE